ncbi:transmembrane protein, putative (macronuclear) [Tetrahymena thermophila SB210]|uniref:Transmembrane protein, putative n=1 Tax=Tetrahymena thermophila (strain SB210) TaxID=312017 RepID=Q24C50_TETTS|nr:transmembrane protein, putative [Tetrahymena thermophila SB210]EAS05388.2 transmembrane protein, putative [Tetrahymena thermophila SB210]|eukprot:XP_001025633.2 transmembrane protein, putative [Tetrahymena thermophila SB210]
MIWWLFNWGMNTFDKASNIIYVTSAQFKSQYSQDLAVFVLIFQPICLMISWIILNARCLILRKSLSKKYIELLAQYKYNSQKAQNLGIFICEIIMFYCKQNWIQLQQILDWKIFRGILYGILQYANTLDIYLFFVKKVSLQVTPAYERFFLDNYINKQNKKIQIEYDNLINKNSQESQQLQKSNTILNKQKRNNHSQNKKNSKKNLKIIEEVNLTLNKNNNSSIQVLKNNESSLNNQNLLEISALNSNQENKISQQDNVTSLQIQNQISALTSSQNKDNKQYESSEKTNDINFSCKSEQLINIAQKSVKKRNKDIQDISSSLSHEDLLDIYGGNNNQFSFFHRIVQFIFSDKIQRLNIISGFVFLIFQNVPFVLIQYVNNSQLDLWDQTQTLSIKLMFSITCINTFRNLINLLIYFLDRELKDFITMSDLLNEREKIEQRSIEKNDKHNQKDMLNCLIVNLDLDQMEEIKINSSDSLKRYSSLQSDLINELSVEMNLANLQSIKDEIKYYLDKFPGLQVTKLKIDLSGIMFKKLSILDRLFKQKKNETQQQTLKELFICCKGCNSQNFYNHENIFRALKQLNNFQIDLRKNDLKLKEQIEIALKFSTADVETEQTLNMKFDYVKCTSNKKEKYIDIKLDFLHKNITKKFRYLTSQLEKYCNDSSKFIINFQFYNSYGKIFQYLDDEAQNKEQEKYIDKIVINIIITGFELKTLIQETNKKDEVRIEMNTNQKNRCLNSLSEIMNQVKKEMLNRFYIQLSDGMTFTNDLQQIQNLQQIGIDLKWLKKQTNVADILNKFLPQQSNIEYLTLNFKNQMNLIEQIQQIFHIIQQSSGSIMKGLDLGLQDLWLDQNKKDFILSLRDLISQSPQLQILLLDLKNNTINNEQIKPLLEAIKNLQKITELRLELNNNQNLDETIVCLLSESCFTSELESLDLKIKPQFQIEGYSYEVFGRLIQATQKMVKSSTNLEYLTLDFSQNQICSSQDNDFDLQSWKNFASQIVASSHLQELCLIFYECKLEQQYLDQITDALKSEYLRDLQVLKLNFGQEYSKNRQDLLKYDIKYLLSAIFSLASNETNSETENISRLKVLHLNFESGLDSKNDFNSYLCDSFAQVKDSIEDLSLNFANNESSITDSHIQAIWKSISSLKKLNKFNLNIKNCAISRESFKNFSDAMENLSTSLTQITILYDRNNTKYFRGKEKVRELQDGLVNLKDLKKLKLHSIKDQDTSKVVITSLSQNKTFIPCLKFLNIKYKWQVIKTINVIELLQHHNNLVNLDLQIVDFLSEKSLEPYMNSISLMKMLESLKIQIHFARQQNYKDDQKANKQNESKNQIAQIPLKMIEQGASIFSMPFSLDDNMTFITENISNLKKLNHLDLFFRFSSFNDFDDLFKTLSDMHSLRVLRLAIQENRKKIKFQQLTYFSKLLVQSFSLSLQKSIENQNQIFPKILNLKNLKKFYYDLGNGYHRDQECCDFILKMKEKNIVFKQWSWECDKDQIKRSEQPYWLLLEQINARKMSPQIIANQKTNTPITNCNIIDIKQSQKEDIKK